VKRRKVISIRWIVSGAAVALTAISVAGMGLFAERNARLALTRELEARLVLEARNLALASSGALLSEFPELTLSPILSKMREDERELVFAVVTDLEGTVRGHADPRRIGEPLQLPSGLAAVTSGAALAPEEAVLADSDVLLASSPVHRRGGERIGTAHVALDRAYVQRTIEQSRRKLLGVVAALFAGGTLFSFLLVSRLLRPVASLREGLERIGRGDLETPVQLRDRTELGLLAETMNEMSRRLRAAREEHIEKERLAREVELAREIQASLLPSGDVCAGDFVISGAHRAAAEVGGDYWDVFPLPGGRTGVAIADVSGKGLAGCLVTSMLAALLRAFRDGEQSPCALLIQLEKHLQQSLRPGTFITMFYGILDPVTGELVFASAGHSPLLIWRGGERRAEWHRTTGIPIGAVRGGALARTLRDERVQLGPGDLAVQYTDGINEAFDLAGAEQYGFDRLQDAVARSAARGCRAVVEAVRHDVAAWAGDQPPLDDETLVILAQEGAAAPASAARASAAPAKATPAATLARARTRGESLALPADLDGLERIHGWLSRFPLFCGLPGRARTLLDTALYETAANIAEHGLAGDPGRTFTLWWLPGSEPSPWTDGRFLFVDDGAPFEPIDAVPVDFRSSAVRRRGRGLGLEIIRSAMRDVEYHPRTPEGNITVLVFDPEKITTEEVTHG
jgi:serine phosphatase RsbU (regulator of sigma subunit)/anti-sigma regulatory factor (Ser/Thr protein kinase)